MGEIVQFGNKRESFIKVCSCLASRLEQLYPRVEEYLEDQDRMLYQKVKKIFKEIVMPTFLTLEEESKFVKKIFFIDGYDAIDEFFYIINYLYFSYEFKNKFLNQKQDVMDAVMLSVMEKGLPYTSYSKYFNILLSDNLIIRVQNMGVKDIKNIFLLMIDDINFEHEANMVLRDCFEYLDDFENRKSNNFKRDISSIFNYFNNQMETFNMILQNNEQKPIFTEDNFKNLRKINRLNFLTLTEKEEFYDIIDGITKNNPLIEQVRFLLMIINIYLEKLPNKGVVEGGKNENRRL